jgi:hypothetical protein
MPNFQDWSVGIGKESTFGTAVTPNRWLEITEAKVPSIDRGIKQGSGIRPGSRVARSARRVQTTRQASGDLTVEAFSKGLGMLLEACMGAGASALVSGSTYQQVHVFADTLPSYTLQYGVPNHAGTIRPITFSGSTVSAFELGGAVGDIAILKTTWDCRNWTTATALTSPSYPAGGNLFPVEDATIYTGTFTAPTSTALASAVTAVAGVRDFKVSVSNQIIADRFFMNAGGLKDRQLPGTRQPTVELNVEYQDNSLWDALEADSELTLVISLIGGALSTGNETMQVAIPCLKLDGDLPEGGPDQIASQAIKLTGLDNLTAAQPMWITTRSSDSAL